MPLRTQRLDLYSYSGPIQQLASRLQRSQAALRAKQSPPGIGPPFPSGSLVQRAGRRYAMCYRHHECVPGKRAHTIAAAAASVAAIPIQGCQVGFRWNAPWASSLKRRYRFVRGGDQQLRTSHWSVRSVLEYGCAAHQRASRTACDPLGEGWDPYRPGYSTGGRRRQRRKQHQ